ncbi:MAG: hypothetical protein K2X82_32775, partial [Gemmataceae bacterium]|nr:hypothetical protein [Gemmataceae bacterium]
MPTLPEFETFWGVDFSGARLAGRNMWAARVEPTSRRAGGGRASDLACTAATSPTPSGLSWPR